MQGEIMTTVRIIVEDAGERRVIHVARHTDTAAALSAALSAVLPQVHLTWTDVLHAARSGRLLHPGGPVPAVGPADPRPHIQRAVAQIASREFAAVLSRAAVAGLAALADAMSGFRRGLQVHPIPPGEPSPDPLSPDDPRQLIVLPGESKEWNAAHPSQQIGHGSVTLSPEIAAGFVSWREGRQVEPSKPERGAGGAG